MGDEKIKYKIFIKDFSDIFSWKYVDMNGLDPSFLTHNLMVPKDAKLV